MRVQEEKVHARGGGARHRAQRDGFAGRARMADNGLIVARAWPLETAGPLDSYQLIVSRTP